MGTELSTLSRTRFPTQHPRPRSPVSSSIKQKAKVSIHWSILQIKMDNRHRTSRRNNNSNSRNPVSGSAWSIFSPHPHHRLRRHPHRRLLLLPYFELIRRENVSAKAQRGETRGSTRGSFHWRILNFLANCA